MFQFLQVHLLGSDEEIKEAYITVLPFVYTIENKESEIIIYPNPVKDILKIQTKKESNEVIYFSVFDPLGKLILSKQLSETTTNVDLTNLHDGLYFVKIKTGEKKQLVKIIKRT